MDHIKQEESPDEYEEYQASESFKKITFAFCVLIIMTQYFFFTMPLAFLVDELINECKHNKVTTGSIVGAFSFSLATGALVSSKVAQFLHPRQTLLITLIVLSTSAPIFFLNLQRTLFTVVLLGTRVVQGFVIGLCEPQLMSVMTSIYPDKLGFVTGCFELAASISSTLGPFIGGSIYQTYGFAVSFMIPGMINFLASSVGVILFWRYNSLELQNIMNRQEKPTKRHNLSSIFILSVVLLGMVTETLISMIVNAIESFYPNFYSIKFQKHESFVGAVLAVAGLVYSIGTVTAGYLVDKEASKKIIICGGIFTMAIGCLGIDPFMLKCNPISAAAMLCVINFGSGITQITILPSLIVQYQYTTKVSRETSSCQMSGLYRAAYFFGAFVGPIAVGFLLEILSYQVVYIVLACTLFVNFVILALIDLIYPNTMELPTSKQSSYENLDLVCSE